MKRWCVVDLLTNAVETSGEALGAHESFDALRAEVEEDPRKLVVELSDYDRMTPELEHVAAGHGLQPHEVTVGIPRAGTVRYDPTTGWLRAAERPAWEVAIGRTFDERKAEIRSFHGVTEAVAAIQARAERDEYEQWDPLEHVFRAGAKPEEIFAGVRTARQLRRARRGKLSDELKQARR